MNAATQPSPRVMAQTPKTGAARHQQSRYGVPFSLRTRAVAATLKWQLNFLPLGWWFWALALAVPLVWALLVSNQILGLGHEVPLHGVIVRSFAEMQVVPALIGVLVVLIDEPGRSRHASALAMPWPRTLLVIRLLAAGLFAWAVAMGFALLASVVIPMVFPVVTHGRHFTAQHDLGALPIYWGLIAVTGGSLSRLIGKLIPSVVTVVGGFSAAVPLIGIFLPMARYLPGVVGLPPEITSEPANTPPQPLGLFLLLLWALGFTALALWKTSHKDC